MPLEGDFTFVLIPADDSRPITERTASKTGGLTDDALIKHARDYFHVMTGAKGRAEQLEQATEADKKAIASQIRKQMSATPDAAQRLDSMDDETVVNLIYKSQVSPSCDISALTIPMPANNYMAVSLYAADNAPAHNLPANPRATALMTACGHGSGGGGGVHGDVFVGRAHDNEATDVWERLDFTVADASPESEWCRVARQAGGGGGAGRAAAYSLSNLVQQAQTQQQASGGTTQQPMQIIDGSAQGNNNCNSNYGLNGAPPVIESWGTWTQTDDEVELRLSVAAGTKAKYCKVSFSRTSLKVVVAGQVLLQGTPFDPIVTDECTYTIDDGGPSGRELCITLSKTEQGRVWCFVAK